MDIVYKNKAAEVKDIFRAKAPKFNFPIFMINRQARVYCELKIYGARNRTERAFWNKVKKYI